MNFVRKAIRWYNRPNKHPVADLIESLFVIVPVVFLIKTFIFGLYQVPTCSMETTMLVGERFLADKLTPYFSTPKRGQIISFNNPNHVYSENKLINFYQQYVDWNVANWTKRVIAVPGDHIEGKIEDGKPVVYVNGVKLDEPYLNKYPVMVVFKSQLGKQGEFVRRSYDETVSYCNQPCYRFDPLEIKHAKKYIGDEIIFYPHTPAHDCHGRDKDIYDVHLQAGQYWMMGDNRQGSYDSRDWGPLDTNKVVWHGRILLRIWSLDSDESWWFVDLFKHPIDFWSRVRWGRFFQVLH